MIKINPIPVSLDIQSALGHGFHGDRLNRDMMTVMTAKVVVMVVLGHGFSQKCKKYLQVQEILKL